jgi:hypothetical protein
MLDCGFKQSVDSAAGDRTSESVRMTADHRDLLQRIDRLERSNRRLTLIASGFLVLPLLMIAGWRQTPQIPEVLQTRKLEIVDAKGVPLVTLNTGRNDEGGALTLRDSDGERRAWWTSYPGGSNLGLVKERDPKVGGGSYTAGFGIGATAAEMNLISPGNGMASVTVRDDQPRVDLWGVKGNTLFAAPFK